MEISKLYDKDNNTSYNCLKELEFISASSNELYSYMKEFLEMLNSDLSYIRVRGFRLICSQAKWDDDNIINNNIDLILSKFDDEKPTSIRQYLSVINNILLYKIELTDKIKNKLINIDYTKYKDTMIPLIKKDITIILNNC